MALTTGRDVMLSDRCCSTARRCINGCSPGRGGSYHVSGHDRILSRASAAVALLLAELEANGEPDCYEAGLYRDILGLV